MKNYRGAFITALAMNLLLAAGLATLWLRSRGGFGKSAAGAVNEVAASGEKPETSSLSSTASVNPGAGPAEPRLVPVRLTPQRMQSIGVKTGLVELKTVFNQIRAVGNVEVDETRLAYVQVRFPGWIRKVFANSTYQYVRKGQPLFTIYSPDVVTTEREYLMARKNRDLLAQSSVPGVGPGATSLLEAAAERLKQWEVPAREIAELAATGKVHDELEIDSPVSGYVTERNALPNQYVQPETRLYTVADLSTVWVYAEVFQSDLGSLKVGDSATVTVDAYPGRTFAGRVSYILPQVDKATRTVRVRLVLPNPGIKLAPGMFVNVQLKMPLGRQLVVPASSLFQSGTRQIAFVDRGDGNLEPREISVGPRAGDEVVVLTGLVAGERIVTSANFLIDSESELQAALGSFVPPPPGAGAAASMNSPGNVPQTSVELTTDPSPPRRGVNTFRVRLVRGGSPVTGAEVSVTFFMPAMPAMGMAAMRTVATLSDKGGGNYEGRGELPSGGTWQVTISARRNGQVIASKELTVIAEGGM